MLIYRSPKTRAWMMTRDGMNYFEWAAGKWQPHRNSMPAAGDTSASPPETVASCARPSRPDTALAPAPDAGRPTAIQRWVKLDGHRAWHRLVGPDEELRQHFIGPRDGHTGDRHGTLCGASGSVLALSTRVDRRSRCPSCNANHKA